MRTLLPPYLQGLIVLNGRFRSPIKLVGAGLVLLEQAHLGDGENHRQRHDSKDFKAHPDIRGERTPHDLVQHGKEGEKEGPAKGQLPPPLVRQSKHLTEHYFE